VSACTGLWLATAWRRPSRITMAPLASMVVVSWVASACGVVRRRRAASITDLFGLASGSPS
jgi:hypothetical protein